MKKITNKDLFRVGRKGPLSDINWGKYKGRTVMDIIEEDPHYIIWCVKNFLDLTPGQANYLEDKINSEIPEEYIVEPPVNNKKTVPLYNSDFDCQTDEF